MKKAVFLDRDGTINFNRGYISDPTLLEIRPGVGRGIRLLNEHGFLTIVVTNQSGIARGLLSPKMLQRIHVSMANELRRESARIDAIYYCPHHPEDGCRCRKPQPGLLEKAVIDYNIDASRSFMIGDRMLDVLAGHSIGCKTILVPEDRELVIEEMQQTHIVPDFVADDFVSGVKWILQSTRNYRK